MTYKNNDDTGFFESEYYVIYVWEIYWKKTRHRFDTEQEAVKFIESGQLNSNGKAFTIIKEKETHTPTKLFFRRKNFSSKKETPVMCAEHEIFPKTEKQNKGEEQQ